MFIYNIHSYNFGFYNSNSLKLRSQLSEKVSLYWVVFKISFFLYIFNFLMMAVSKVETFGRQQNLITGSVVTDGLCFFTAVYVLSSTKTV